MKFLYASITFTITLNLCCLCFSCPTPSIFSVNHNFNYNLIESIKNIYLIQLRNVYDIDDYILSYKLELIIKDSLKIIFIQYMPTRSYTSSIII